MSENCELRYVAEGDVIEPSDHNCKVEALFKIYRELLRIYREIFGEV